MSASIQAGSVERRTEILTILAEEVLGSLQRIADAARAKLREGRVGSDAFIQMNEFTAQRATANLNHVQSAITQACIQLRDEPAIARVVAADDDDQLHTVYICRSTPVTCDVRLASSLSPVGRLAALPVGDFLLAKLPGDRARTLTIVEKTSIKPMLVSGQWDSSNGVYHSENNGPISITSLRAFLKKIGIDEDDLDELERLLAEGDQAANVVEGLRRSVLQSMQLRDQPILDKFQDEIFRLPLDSRLVIMGPPGTGKTTTLVRRLRLKIDREWLEDEERAIVDDQPDGMPPHAESWMMFTPTELLKQYVKEAFAREGVPAPEQRIRIWTDFRRELGRRHLPILKSPLGGSLIFNEKLDPLLPETITHQIDWFEDFDSFQRSMFVAQMGNQVAVIEASADPVLARIGTAIRRLLDAETATPTSLIVSLAGSSEDLRDRVSALDEFVRADLRKPLARQINSDPAFLDDLARYTATLANDQDDDGEDPDAIETDADDEDDVPQQGRRAAQQTFLKALRAQAVAEARRRPVNKNSRNGRILQWLSDRGVKLQALDQVGQTVMVQRAARRLLRAPTLFVREVPSRYRAFRRERLGQSIWYRDVGLPAGDVSPLELDVVILAFLQNARALLGDANLLRRLGDRVPTVVSDVQRLLRNQILVDEATDFSPIQLACMVALSNPDTNSFFACGDFNQRLTTWGSKSQAELAWVLPDVEVREIDVAYRQSRRLNELASKLASSGGEEPRTRLPEYVDNEGVSPVYGANLSKVDDLAEWLALRIAEIEEFTGQLPSIAVLVESPELMHALADSLSDSLADRSLRAVACPDGKVMGQENDIRVFEVQHIKGLEFEAVFFVGIDGLEHNQPALFEKYLYVGATRAATYLGVTTEGPTMPARLDAVAELFGTSW